MCVCQNCQAQPQPQLQLSWAEIALISSKTPTHPPRTSSKVERLRDIYDLNSDCNKVGNTSFWNYFTRTTSEGLLHYIYFTNYFTKTTLLLLFDDFFSLELLHYHYFTRSTTQEVVYLKYFTNNTSQKFLHYDFFTITTSQKLLHLNYFTELTLLPLLH